jgi:pimeloyl-ACP methyl ester carboxylesterase
MFVSFGGESEMGSLTDGQVFTPDLRGHGASGGLRGDVRYEGQLDDDMIDFIAHIRATYAGPFAGSDLRVVLGGHGAGAGLVLRAARLAAVRHEAAGYMLLAPFVSTVAPFARQQAEWVRPRLAAVLGVEMLRLIGVHWLDEAPVVDYHVPKDGTGQVRGSPLDSVVVSDLTGAGWLGAFVHVADGEVVGGRGPGWRCRCAGR